MNGATTTCPVCDRQDPDCLACAMAVQTGTGLDLCPRCYGESCALCNGIGAVLPGALEECPADHEPYGPRCRHCGGSRWVKADDFEAIRDRLNEDAYAERMAQRGLHVSGVPFEGPF